MAALAAFGQARAMSDRAAEDGGSPAAWPDRPRRLDEQTARWAGLALLAVVVLMTAATVVHLLVRRY